MTTAFTAMDRVLFASTLSLPATYTPAAGSPVAVRVIRCRGDAMASLGQVGVNRAPDLFDLQAAEVAQPVQGDGLSVTEHGAATSYKVRSAVPDTSRLVWRLDCAKQI